MREGYRLTGDRYRLGRGPVWKHNDIGGLDSRFVDFSLDSNCWLADLGHSLSGLERQLRFYSIFFTLRAFGFMVDLFIR